MCYSLNTAYYFFGHEARTALGQAGTLVSALVIVNVHPRRRRQGW